MLDKIITIYAIVDDLLKAIGHTEDIRCQMTDAEVITTALITAIFFGGNHSQACCYMNAHKLIPKMLQKSRFNRRLHRLFMLMNDIFYQMGMILKEISEHTEYLLDCFPIALCDNIRIFNVKLIQSEDYRGYIASKKRYFYGVKVHLISTKDGIPVELVFIPGEANDVRGLNALPLNLPPGSQLYADAGYTDYNIEDDIEETGEFCLEVMRKNNSKRQDLPWEQYIKQHTRHYIETVFSSITCRNVESLNKTLHI